MVSNYDMYVYLSYLPNIAEANICWLDHEADPAPGHENEPESWWIQRGVRTFKETMKNQLVGTPVDATHVVPLSGGLDSRAILGGLIENLPTQQVRTVTYGIPGSYDFEFGRSVAQKAGVRHEAINLQDEEWDLNSLITTAACLDHPISVFEAYVRRKLCEYFGSGCIFWTGFLAGSLAGVHVPPVPSAGKEAAIERFLESNRTPRFQNEVFHQEMARKIRVEYPWEENLHQTKMTLDQQLDFGIRHRYYIGTVCMVSGYHFKAPFITKPWVSFILNVPYRWLPHEYLYKKVVNECYPDLFQLPVRNNAGLPLSASHTRFLLSKVIAKIRPRIFRKDPYGSDPRTNYINFSESLRHKTRFQALVYSTLQDLKQRGIFSSADIDIWWNDHLTRKRDNKVLLLNLSSLEILMKSGRI